MSQNISVLVEDLDIIRAALNAAYNKEAAQDLAEGYRKLNVRPSYSALTKSIEGALALTMYYLEQENDGSAEAESPSEPAAEPSVPAASD